MGYNIYIDSKYTLIANKPFYPLEGKGLPLYKGTPFVNGLFIAILEALQFPTEVAIIHCWKHQASKDPEAIGNARAK